MEKNSRIYVAGHRGLVGSAIVRALMQQGYRALIQRTHSDLDLTDRQSVRAFFERERPEHVILAAAKVGGIFANDRYPADFIRENLEIETNVIDASYRTGVKRLLFLGSSCIYPKLAPQPMKEEYLLTGPLEPTNRAYALAKIAGIEMCGSYNRQYGTSYLAAMPTNLYGPGDNFDAQRSHVLPALMRKVIEAKHAGKREVVVWGTGKPRREFLYSDDLAEACVHLLNLSDGEFGTLISQTEAPLINIGTGEEGRVLRDAKAVLFTCEEERNRAKGVFKGHRYVERVVLFGTADPGESSATQKAAFRSALPALQDRRFLLFLSRIHPKKGCDLLIQAFADLVPELPQDFDLVMAGPDQVGWAPELQSFAKRLGVDSRIHWPGMLRGNVKWGAYRCAHAFVLPSHQENFGIVVAEAMACGTPVLISTKVNIWREVEGAKAGLVGPDTLEGTRNLIRRFMAMPNAEYMQMSQDARAGFLRHFDVEVTARDFSRAIGLEHEAIPEK